jgi:hypothetical protein
MEVGEKIHASGEAAARTEGRKEGRIGSVEEGSLSAGPRGLPHGLKLFPPHLASSSAEFQLQFSSALPDQPVFLSYIMNQILNRSLFSQGEIVLRRYQALQLTLRELDIKSILHDQAVGVEETKDRFVIWASNIGLFNPAHSSLDYRLRDNEQIRDFVNSLLEALGNTVQKGEYKHRSVKQKYYLSGC